MTEYNVDQLSELLGTFTKRAFDALEVNDEATSRSYFTRALDVAFQLESVAGTDRDILWSARSRQAMLFYFIGETKKAEELAKYVVKQVNDTFLAPMVLFWIAVDKTGKRSVGFQTGNMATDVGIGAFNWIMGNQKVNEAKDKAAGVIIGYSVCVQVDNLEFEWLHNMTAILVESVVPFLENVKDKKNLQALYRCIVNAPWDRFSVLTPEQVTLRDELLIGAHGALRRLA